MRWLQLFGTKTNLSRLSLVFQELDDGVFTENDMTQAFFAHLCHKYEKRDINYLRQAFSEPSFSRIFPGGLYRFFIENGYPNVPFPYNKPKDFLSNLKNSLMKDQLEKAKVYSLILFGRENAPLELQGLLNTLRARLIADYNSMKLKEQNQFKWVRRIIGQPSFLEGGTPEDYRELIREMISVFDKLVILEAIEYGDARLTPRKSDFLVSERLYLKRLRSFLTPTIETSD